MRETRKQQEEQSSRRTAPTPVGERIDTAGVGEVLELQDAIGNRATARRIAAQRQAEQEQDADDMPTAQRALVDAALRSPGRQLGGPMRERLERFHQTDLSGVRLHSGAIAQRSTEAIGASAFTVGNDIVLGPNANNAKTLGHETGHVKQQSEGAVAGSDNGAGLSISDPRHHEERSADADGKAFDSGAEHAPSLGSHSGGAESHAGHHHVQRLTTSDDDSSYRTSSSGSSSSEEYSTDESSDEEESSSDEDRPKRAPAQSGTGQDKSKAGLVKAVQDVVAEGTSAHGGGRHGRVTEQARLRFNRPYEHQRGQQTVSQLSLLLHDTLRRVQDDLAEVQGSFTRLSDREVQGMMINDRLMFATNFNDTIDNVETRFQEGIARLRQLLREHQQDDAGRTGGLLPADANEYRERIARAQRKIESLIAGTREMANQATADALRANLNGPVVVVDAGAANMRELLTAPEHRGTTFLLTFRESDGRNREGERRPKSMHAEQKLLVAIDRSGLKPDQVKGEFVIVGKYRPCMGCAAALRYYQEAMGFETLQYNPNYGHFYTDSVESLASHLSHVVGDPRYLEYIREMVNADGDSGNRNAVSTSALSNQEPPAEHDDVNGPEIRIDASDAQGRGYRTPSESEGEGKKTARAKVPYKPGAGGRRIGKGTKKASGGRRAQRFLTPAQEKLVRDTWLRGNSEEQAALFKHFSKRKGDEGPPVSQKELSEATQPKPGEEDQRKGATPNKVGHLVNDKTGHKDRDNARAPGTAPKRVPTRGKKADPTAPKKPRGKGDFKKGGPMDSDGEKEINKLIKQRQPSYDQLREKAEADGKKVKPALMRKELGQGIADLRSEYNIGGLAGKLVMSEDALRKHLNRTYGKLNEKSAKNTAPPPPAAPARAEDEDVVMGGMDEEAQDEESGYPDVPGYRHFVDYGTGQHYYQDRDGGQYFYDLDRGQMTLIQAGLEVYDPDEVVAGPSGTRWDDHMEVDPGAEADTEEEEDDVLSDSAMQVDEEDEVYEGKGKGRSRRG
ncbi:MULTISPECIES: DUF4157 domain-containing protein [Actinosynnema]|uniref:eCIS core domain-containing protein n=1 Tax=Actinosynnema TaxID=40566 RepID=UPI0020A30B2F|nr:DUF4157 domain-containing protein [Actinosynnema pretiosum]MCP2099878.1 protein of unknown function (DUF4157) [Actinosynnema pretiosum]